MKKLSILLVIIIGFGMDVQSQNLILNGDFEYVSPCPNNVGLMANAPPWYNPAPWTSIHSPDLFNSCSSLSWISTPTNWLGFQNPRSGNGYAGCGLIYDPYVNFREYIAIPLNLNLSLDSCYYLEFYVNLADSSRYAVDRISVYFSTNIISNNPIVPLPFIPQFTTTIGFITDTVNWVKISTTYQASGGENSIIIGNFYNDTLTNKIVVNNNTSWANAYYYFEDFTLLPINCLSGIIDLENHLTNLVFDYSESQLSIKNLSNQPVDYFVLDSTGRIIINEFKVQSGSVDLSHLKNGLYFGYLTQNGKFLKRIKFSKSN